MEWFIKSNALVKSRKTVPTKLLLFIALIQVSTIAYYIENSQVVQLWNHAITVIGQIYHTHQQEPGFYENEYIYDDIEGLEEMLLDVRIFLFYRSGVY